MLNYEFNKSTVSFAEQCKYILTESYCIAGKIGNSNI